MRHLEKAFDQAAAACQEDPVLFLPPVLMSTVGAVLAALVGRELTRRILVPAVESPGLGFWPSVAALLPGFLLAAASLVLLSLLVGAGMQALFVAVAEGRRPDLSTFWLGAGPFLLRYLGINLLSALVRTAAGIVIGLGTVLGMLGGLASAGLSGLVAWGLVATLAGAAAGGVLRLLPPAHFLGGRPIWRALDDGVRLLRRHPLPLLLLGGFAGGLAGNFQISNRFSGQMPPNRLAYELERLFRPDLLVTVVLVAATAAVVSTFLGLTTYLLYQRLTAPDGVSEPPL